MVNFTFHTPETAPEAAKDRLEKALKDFGFIPNLWAVQAEAPAVLEGYQTLASIFEKTSFTATERQVVTMTANFEHNCTFCMAGHSWIAGMQGVDQAVIDALRAGTPMPDMRLEALHRFTRAVIMGRGWVSDEETRAFLAAGYLKQQILEVILGISLKVMSNYTNHFAQTPPNAAFEHLAWQKPATAAAE